MKKRILSTFMAVVMVLGLVVIPDTGFVTETEATWRGTLLWPIPNENPQLPTNPRHTFRSSERPNHDGIDILRSRGTQIVAAAAGEVMFTRSNCPNNNFNLGCNCGCGGSGNNVRIFHESLGNLQTRYLHLTEVHVSVGQWVNAGQVIGTMGSTGDSSTDHLHFETRIGARGASLGGTAHNPNEWAYTRGGGVSINMTVIPNPAGPYIIVSHDGTEMWYTLRRGSEIIAQEPVALRSNEWDFSRLGEGTYTFEVQANRNGIASELKTHTFTIVPPPPNCRCGFPISSHPTRNLSSGSSGEDVRWLQTALNNILGVGILGTLLVVDGQFGFTTFKAVETFQIYLDLTVDGVFKEEVHAKIYPMICAPLPTPPTIEMIVIPNSAGPQITITHNGTELWWSFRRDGVTLNVEPLTRQSNTWDFALWILQPGNYTFEVQSNRDGLVSEFRTHTFTIAPPTTTPPVTTTAPPTTTTALPICEGCGQSQCMCVQPCDNCRRVQCICNIVTTSTTTITTAPPTTTTTPPTTTSSITTTTSETTTITPDTTTPPPVTTEEPPMPPFTPSIAEGNPTIGDALEILKYLAGLPNDVNTAGSRNPTIGDVLEVLKKLAGLPSVFEKRP
jgi:murein DD-endopeptidase MepM/ murein hydrolase activator NlpD